MSGYAGAVKMSAGVEWGIHCCVVLSQAGDRPVSAQRLADFHGLAHAYLAKNLQFLSRAGLVRSTGGRVGGYLLNRPADELTVLDIVEAIEGAGPAFRCTEIRRNGPFATSPDDCVRPCGVAQVMATAESAWRTSLRAVTVADLAATTFAGSNGQAPNAMRDWITL